jgi:hypothetical protein
VELRISISGAQYLHQWPSEEAEAIRSDQRHSAALSGHRRTWSAELRISDADAVLPSTSKMSGSSLYAPSSKAA